MSSSQDHGKRQRASSKRVSELSPDMLAKLGAIPAQPAIRKSSLTEQAYQKIKVRILTAQYEPGRFLQENAICEELEMGRTPVHQALQRLMQEDLLEVIPRKGVLIRLDSLDEILLALEVRGVLEPYCASKAATRLSKAQLKEMDAIQAETIAAVRRQSKPDLLLLDRRFHSLIASGAGNPMIADFLRPVHERLTRLWFQPRWAPSDFSQTEGEHDAIIAAIKRQDADGAMTAMREHITSLHGRLISAGGS